MPKRLDCYQLLFALGCLAAQVELCQAQFSEFLKSVPIGTDHFGLAIRPGTNGWLTLEFSSDLRSWSELATIATTNSATVFVDEANVGLGQRFYRMRLPGTTTDQAEARWLSSQMTSYRFQMQRVSVTQSPYFLSGTVTVRMGEKAVADAMTEIGPVDPADPADFPTVEELFAALKAAQQAGCHQVYALYDAAIGFPTRCFIDHRAPVAPPANPGTAIEYRITGLQRLSSPLARLRR